MDSMNFVAKTLPAGVRSTNHATLMFY